MSERDEWVQMEAVPRELEGLCQKTKSRGAGKWRCPAWAYDLFEEAEGWIAGDLARITSSAMKKRNALLARLEAAAKDPEQAAAEEAIWRLQPVEDEKERARFGFCSGGFTGAAY